MEKKHRLASDGENEPSPKRASYTASPLALIAIKVNPEVTQQVECLSPLNSSNDDDCHPELSQLTRYKENEKKGTMRLKLDDANKASMSHYDLTSLENGELVDIELGHDDRSVTLGREIFTSNVQKATATALGLGRLSSRHCLVEWRADDQFALYVTDLSSTNGTFINSTRIAAEKPTRVTHGDVIQLAFVKHRPSIGCKLRYVVDDPRICRIDTPYRSPVTTLGHNGILFAGPLCYYDGPKLRSHDTLNFQKEYDGLKESLVKAANMTSNPHVDGCGIPMVQAPPKIDISVSFATLDALHMMVSSKCRVLHYSGHGSASCLYFESDERQGLADPIPYSTLVNVLRGPGQHHLRLVVVNSCNSEHIAKAFVDCGVPHVIAIRGDTVVEDSEAVHFTQSFYLNLATGLYTVEECFRNALTTISCSPHRTVLPTERFKVENETQVALFTDFPKSVDKFTLLPEDDSHHEVIFPGVAVPSAMHIPYDARFLNLWNCPLPPLCQNFRFRSIEMLRLCGYLTEESDIMFKRWIWITGPPGVGKTQLAYACASYLNPRMAFLGGIYVLNVATFCDDSNSAIMTNSFHPNEELYDKLDCELDELRSKASRRMQRLHKLTRHIHGVPMLVVLDGCEPLLHDATIFAAFINNKLTDNIGLKIITTSQYFYHTDRVHDHGLYVFNTKPLTRRASAKLLVDIVASRKISIHTMQRSPLYDSKLADSPENIVHVLSAHPKIRDLCGIPKAIVQCAEELKQTGNVDALIK
ncbi:hypothetical protein LEN26_006140 [Aphanomyces euteiches]|nr:hypothetical protein AeMF1_018882 [Aphanomyces euteiches]KAH9136491.1 hypothetical protein LEN26_006140 [Aphanomyces euteiches]KAH9192822.1 hypothetical protein AeNC1_005204 [Aphanomyces euteiches]